MILLLNIVGLTPGHIGEHTPNLRALAAREGVRALGGIFPALTLSAQASILTGLQPAEHGVVGNGWLFRDTMECRLWQQSRALCTGGFFYEKARARGLRVAKLFWWFNQGAHADLCLTPKPYYSCDGNKAFGIHGLPEGFSAEVEAELGKFPFPAFWGPEAGAGSTEWIARAAELTISRHRPDMVMAYLPHLDYDLQRFGESGAHLPQNLRSIDRIAGRLIDRARAAGYRVVVLSEYGITTVSQPVHINRILREAGLLAVRPGPFGEILETFNSAAFAVADHQIAHVYIKDASRIPEIKAMLEGVPGIARALDRSEQREFAINHPRAGELVLLSEPQAWFTWYYHRDPRHAPDFARTVDIHRKPGYDPAELFYDTRLRFPRLSAGARLLRKKLGFRYRFDVISDNAELVRGSHGLPARTPTAGPVFISSAPGAPDNLHMCGVGEYILRLLESGDA